MQNNLSDLQPLLERLKGATGPDREESAIREEIARIIDPSAWRVMDGYLADMRRKYRGQDAGYDPEAFKHKGSLAKADEIIALLQALIASKSSSETGE